MPTATPTVTPIPPTVTLTPIVPSPSITAGNPTISQNPTISVAPSISVNPSVSVAPLACPAACNYPSTITNGPGRDHGDANCDGLVNLNDFGIWLDQYQAAIASEVNGVRPIIPADQRSANFACNLNDATTQIVGLEDFKVWLNSYTP